MTNVKSCEFNIDNACVEVIYQNGSKMFLYVPMIEEAYRTTNYSKMRMDLLIESEPLEYVRMVTDGTMQEYLDRIDGIYHSQEQKIAKQIQEKKGCSESMASYLAREYLMYDS